MAHAPFDLIGRRKKSYIPDIRNILSPLAEIEAPEYCLWQNSADRRNAWENQ
jgi:hypothetical protein